MTEKNQKLDIVQLMAELVRSNSVDSKLTKSEEFTFEPISLPEEEIGDRMKILRESEEYQDIQFIEGTSEIYLYSKQYMTNNYAIILARIEEQDFLSLIAKMVRDDSRIYPRPTDVRLFSVSQFNFSDEEFKQFLEEIKKNEVFKDIQEVRASNEALYLYSDKYLVTDHAIALTEWIEVIQKEIP